MTPDPTLTMSFAAVVERLLSERDAAVKRAEEAEAEVARLREALAACLRIASDLWTEPEKEKYIRLVVDEALAAVSK